MGKLSPLLPTNLWDFQIYKPALLLQTQHNTCQSTPEAGRKRRGGGGRQGLEREQFPKCHWMGLPAAVVVMSWQELVARNKTAISTLQLFSQKSSTLNWFTSSYQWSLRRRVFTLESSFREHLSGDLFRTCSSCSGQNFTIHNTDEILMTSIESLMMLL